MVGHGAILCSAWTATRWLYRQCLCMVDLMQRWPPESMLRLDGRDSCSYEELQRPYRKSAAWWRMGSYILSELVQLRSI